MPTGQDFPVWGLLSSYWILANLESSNSVFVSNLLKVNVDLADLLIAAAKTRVINIEKGQFCAFSVSHSIFK
jgi:3-deoxy-D-manno-octulosonic acid (KDO) 8-phosphate synthase